MAYHTIGEERLHTYESIEIEGKRVLIPHPATIPDVEIITRPEIIEKTLAAWLTLDGLHPLNFRLYGPPGVGKNAIVYELARNLRKDLYIINGHEELGPEDIACTATMSARNTVEYVASPIFAAMIRGGILFFDEIAKAPSSALAPLASVLDDRRSLTSVLGGIHLAAHRDFLFCAALNEDEEQGIGLRGYIDERTRPAIYVGYPSSRTLEQILRSRLPMADNIWFEVFRREFQHQQISSRTALTLLGFAFRMAQQAGSTSLTKRQVTDYLMRARAETQEVKDGSTADPAIKNASGGNDDALSDSHKTGGRIN